MRLLIHRDYENVCRWTADYIVKKINAFAPSRERPFVLGLPTGSSPLGVYKKLIAAFREGKVSFSSVITLEKETFPSLKAAISFLYTPKGLEPVGSPSTKGFSGLGLKSFILFII